MNYANFGKATVFGHKKRGPGFRLGPCSGGGRRAAPPAVLWSRNPVAPTPRRRRASARRGEMGGEWNSLLNETASPCPIGHSFRKNSFFVREERHPFRARQGAQRQVEDRLPRYGTECEGGHARRALPEASSSIASAPSPRRSADGKPMVGRGPEDGRSHRTP